ncbi:MAG TPA: GGDEF domain-containing protein [Thermoanaerobaculia bacterium]
MELLLWRWSTTAQIASAFMIAVFFVVLSRPVRRVELRPWVAAWLAMTRSNRDLLDAQEVLQDLVDLDPLTGLANRRALPAVFRESSESGATILFFDLNDFKRINDAHGHAAGDDCLKRFARALQSSFRPDDHLIRYAGDEFVVVAPGVAPPDLGRRIDALRERLKFDRNEGPEIRFSVGTSHLPVHGDAQAALRAADDAMYVEKSRKNQRAELG